MVAINTEPADIELIKTAPDGDPGASRTRRLAVIVLALVVLLAAAALTNASPPPPAADRPSAAGPSR